jgi:hypothetical protein
MEWNVIGKNLATMFRHAEIEKETAEKTALNNSILAKLAGPEKKAKAKAESGKIDLQTIFRTIVAENPGISQNLASVETYRRAGRNYTGNHFVNHFSALVKLGKATFGPVVFDLDGGKAKQGLYLK